jgi:methionyl-tRNA formyltransferase
VRIAFAGSPVAAVAPLRALAESHHELALVVSQPDRRRGRSGRPTPTAVAAAAQELGLPVIRPDSINSPEALEELERAEIGALTVAAFGQILREGVLGRWPCINVHYSLLPAYRGAAPVERALLDGVERTGVTIMEMEAGLDTGPILAVAGVDVEPEEEAGSLTARLSELGGPLLIEVLDRLEAGTLEATPQPEEGVSLAPKIGPEDRPLDFSRPAIELARRVRALSPHVGATCAIDGQPFTIWRARAREETTPPGLTVVDGRLVAGAGEGSLELVELQPAGRGRMSAADLLRGWRGELRLEAP